MNKDSIYLFLKKNGSSIEKDVYDYGVMIFTTYLKYLAVLIPFAFLFHIQKYVLLFLIFFIPLRRFIGGYHMKTMKACFFGSIALALILPIFALYLNKIPLSINFLVFIIVSYMTYKIGVIDHPNKRINNVEKDVYKKRAIIIEIIYFILISFFNYIEYYHVSNIILLILIFCIAGMFISCR